MYLVAGKTKAKSMKTKPFHDHEEGVVKFSGVETSLREHMKESGPGKRLTPKCDMTPNPN